MITSQNPCLLFGKPFLNLEVSALRAHPVFTGIVPYSLNMSVRACLGVSAQNRSAAYHEAMGRFADVIRQLTHLLIGGISDQQYGLNRWVNHSMRYVNHNDKTVKYSIYNICTLGGVKYEI